MPLKKSDGLRLSESLHATKLEDVFYPEELAARAVLMDTLGLDPFSYSQTWERLVARMTTGEMTKPRFAWDVTLEHRRVEVKFSKAYAQITNAAFGPRMVFKWAEIKPENADAFVLIGMDVDERLYSWCFSPVHFRGRSSSLTLIAPSAAMKPGRLNWAAFPLPEVLSAILETCHLRLDGDHHRKKASSTRARRAAVGTAQLFEEEK